VCANDMLLHGAYEEKRVDVSGALAGWLLLGGPRVSAPRRDVCQFNGGGAAAKLGKTSARRALGLSGDAGLGTDWSPFAEAHVSLPHLCNR
jgi:hypothetical protein